MAKLETIRLLKEKRNRLVTQWWASISIILLIIISLMIGKIWRIIGIFLLFIFPIISLISKSTPYQLKNQIHDVDIELSKISEYKEESFWKYI